MSTTHPSTSIHSTRLRTAIEYPRTPPRCDPLATDVTTSWPVIVVTLLLVPPLGALQLAHRTDLPRSLRAAIATLALAVVAMSWATGLHLLPMP